MLFNALIFEQVNYAMRHSCSFAGAGNGKYARMAAIGMADDLHLFFCQLPSFGIRKCLIHIL